MNIKDFQRESKRPHERTVFERILADISLRGPLPPIGKGFALYRDSIKVGEGQSFNSLALPDEDGWIWHVCVMDLNRPDKQIFLLETRTKDGEFGFKSFKLFRAEAAVFISFDIVQFFYERVGYLKGKPLDVEKLLQSVYNDIPETYSMKLNIKSRQKDNAPIIEWHKAPPKEQHDEPRRDQPERAGSSPVHSGESEVSGPAGGTLSDDPASRAGTPEGAGSQHVELPVPQNGSAGEQDAQHNVLRVQPKSVSNKGRRRKRS